jgi:hypothetical protein
VDFSSGENLDFGFYFNMVGIKSGKKRKRIRKRKERERLKETQGSPLTTYVCEHENENNQFALE